jgi:hypothetical protein
MNINRASIALLGNPTHLKFYYQDDGDQRLLYIRATSEDDLDSFEIPQYFWNSSSPCVVARIAFFIALQYRLKWEEGLKYIYPGTFTELHGFPAVAFKLDRDTEFTRNLSPTPFDRCFLDFGVGHFSTCPS